MVILLGYSMMKLPVDDRVEIVCERQDEFVGVRESFLKLAFEMDDWKTPEGMPRIAKWGSIPKSRILEPSDFAAYALMQLLRDEKSIKTALCAPILLNPKRIGHCIGREEARLGIEGCITATDGKALAPASPQMRAYVRKRFNEAYGTWE
jgi:hypothetical protein